MIAVLSLALAVAFDRGETKFWEVATREQFAQGVEFRQVVLRSRGELVVGPASTQRELPGEPSFWCGVLLGRGEGLVGTGTGKIYRFDDDSIDLEFETAQLLVTSLIRYANQVYASTIGAARIYRRSPAGEWAQFATVESEFLWALAATPQGDILAAGGNPGRVYRVGADGAVTTLYEGEGRHVLAIAPSAGGEIYAGTSQPGRLVEIREGRGRILHDFGQDEARAVALRGLDVYVGVNHGADKPPHEFLRALEQSREQGQQAMPQPPGAAPEGEPPAPTQEGEEEPPRPTPPTPAPAAPRRATPAADVSAALWRFAANRSERLADFGASYITALAPLEQAMLVGTHNSGRVFRVQDDGAFDLWAEFAQRQVLAFLGAAEAPLSVLLGDFAALGQVPAARAAEGVYVSQVHDAAFPSQWGTLTWAGEGRVGFETRSGHVSDPKHGWTEWESATGDGRERRIGSPRGRYLQVRATLAGGDARLSRITVAYRNENQRPVVASIAIQAVAPRREGATAGRPAGPSPAAGQPHATQKKVTWQASDPDNDSLVYRISLRAAGSELWVPLTPEPGPKPEYVWNTDEYADGWYVLQVEASDELANPTDGTLRGWRDTEPILVDNTPPVVVLERAQRGLWRGRATDATSPIRRLEYRVGGGEWRSILPADGIFDSIEETFEIREAPPAAGAVVVTVRALDQENNVGTTSLTLTGD